MSLDLMKMLSPGSATRRRSTLHPSCFSAVSLIRQQIGNYGSRVREEIHFRSWICRSMIPPPASRVLSKVSQRYSRPVAAGLSPSSMKKTRGSLNGSIPLELGYGPENRQPASDQSIWKALKRVALCVAVASVMVWTFMTPRASYALAENSIGASSLGLKVANVLRGSGLSDELAVVIVAMLPVLELRGAIPISYWLQIDPVKGFVLSVIGNMIPVPLIVLYLERILKTVGENSESGLKFVRWLVDRTRRKAGPIEEFEWLGLMLFVAVPLPGTGAWSGAICASILDMPFWDAVTANFFGVVLAGLLVTLLVRVGTREAGLVGIGIILSSTLLWTVLRLFQRKKKEKPPV